MTLSVVVPDNPYLSSIHRSSDGDVPLRDGDVGGDGVVDDGGDETSSNFRLHYRSSNNHRWSPLETTCYCGDASQPSPEVVP